MKKQSIKIATVTAKKMLIGCPNWGNVSADVASGTFKATVNVLKETMGYFLVVDGGDKNTAFAKITAVTDDEKVMVAEADIATMIDDVISKEHEIVNISIVGDTVTGDLCQIAFISKTAKKTTENKALGKDIAADAMSEHISEMVSLGAMTEENGKVIYDILMENKILRDTLLCERLYGYWKNHWEHFGNKDPKKVTVPRPIYKDPALEEEINVYGEGIISEGLRCALSQHGMVAQGGKSVGKNVWCNTIAFLLNVPISLLTFSRTMAPSAIYGEKTTDNSAVEELYGDKAKNLAIEAVQNHVEGAAEFALMKARAASVRIVQDQSELYDALQYGRLMVMNEMNLADANLFASFANQMLDGTGFLFIPGRGEVSIPKEFVFVGTQNEDYEGCEDQNEATTSRMAFITFPQPKTIIPQLRVAVEAEIKNHGVIEMDEDTKKKAEEAYKQVEKFYKFCKASSVDDGKTEYANLVSETVLNIRGFVRAIAEYLESGGIAKLGRKIQIQVINSCPSDERETLNVSLRKFITV